MSTSILISLLFVVVLQYLYKGGKIRQLEWDISTVTAGDYTVELPISAEAYQTWYSGTYKSYYGEFGYGVAAGMSLKKHLVDAIEKALKEEILKRNAAGMSQLNRKNTHSMKEISENVNIADIVFSFNNSALIHALRERG